MKQVQDYDERFDGSAEQVASESSLHPRGLSVEAKL